VNVVFELVIGFGVLAGYGLIRFLLDLMHADWGGPSGFDAGIERTATELGVRFGRRRGGSTWAAGTIGDATLTISTKLMDNSFETPDPFTNLVVTVEGPRIPRGLSFDEGGGEDVLTGDAVFDDTIEVRGQPSVVLALLTRSVRDKVAVFVRNGGTLRDGRLTGRTRLTVAQSDIPACARMTWRLAEALSSADGGGICQRLARNAVEDPVPGVRLLNLLQLHDTFGDSTEAREASRAALADASPWVRLSAARFLHEEVETLEALSRDREVPDQAAAEAVALLAARLPSDRAGPLFVDVMKTRTGEAAREAIDQLGRLRHAPAFGPLVVVMDRGDARTAAAAATALGALGDPRAEVSLLRVVERDALELRTAAVRALGVVGSIRSVAPLLALLDKRALDAATATAIRGAVSSIQSRLVGAEAGQLTVAASEAESGRLSLAQPQAGPGDLTLAKPETAE
jgi:HEAT repeat protein